MNKRVWTRRVGGAVAIVGAAAGVAGVLATLFVAEVRTWLGFETPAAHGTVAPAAAINPAPRTERAVETLPSEPPSPVTLGPSGTARRVESPPVSRSDDTLATGAEKDAVLPDLLRPDVRDLDRAVAVVDADGRIDEYASAEVARVLRGRADVFSRHAVSGEGLARFVAGDLTFSRLPTTELVVGRAETRYQRSSFDKAIHEAVLTLTWRVVAYPDSNAVHVVREVGGGLDRESARIDAIRKVAATTRQRLAEAR